MAQSSQKQPEKGPSSKGDGSARKTPPRKKEGVVATRAADGSTESGKGSGRTPRKTANVVAMSAASEKTRRHVKSLFELFTSHARDLFPADGDVSSGVAADAVDMGPAGASTKGRDSDSSGKGLALNVLQALPWIYALGFGISFLWDFTGLGIELFGMRVALDGLLRIISVSGLIGFLTNWLAITMLFRPSKRRPLLGQGLIPANKDRVALRLSKAVAEDLINPELIQRKIHESQWIRTARIQTTESLRTVVDNPAFRQGLRDWMRGYLDDLISDAQLRAELARSILLNVEAYLEDRSIERFAYRAYRFLKGDEAQRLVEEALEKIPESVDGALNRVDKLLDDLPETIEKNSEKIEHVVTSLLFRLINRLNVEQLVLENLIQYDESRLERMIKGATHEQLSYIQYLGALLGGIGGLVIWQPVLSLLVMGVFGGTILATDTLLIHASSARPGRRRTKVDTTPQERRNVAPQGRRRTASQSHRRTTSPPDRNERLKDEKAHPEKNEPS